jgi:hypothetical protein
MITDLVQGGSVNSPLFLFDEQNLNIETAEHATSNSWKPDYVMNETSYHAVIDLGQDYYISEINLCDMHNTNDFKVAYGDASNWTTLFVDPCDNFNTWSKNTTAISTRYLRFSMCQSVFAAVNEIFIYGHPIASNSAKSRNGKKSSSESIFDSPNIELYPNPIDKNLNVKFPVKMIGKSKLSIRALLSKTLYNKKVLISVESSILELTNLQLPKTNGIYLLSIFHESGKLKTLKFIKKN